MSKNLHVAIVGATGAVGVEMLKTLEKRKFPLSQLTLLASAKSAGKTLPFRGEDIPVQELREDSFAGVDVALFSAGGSISKKFAPLAVQSGCVVVDNSSAFRMDADVPLVVPEINGADIKKNRGIIANPNCTTAQRKRGARINGENDQRDNPRAQRWRIFFGHTLALSCGDCGAQAV